MDMAGRIALVTGGSQGIGAATVKAFAKRGAYVFIASRNEEKGREVLSQVKEQGGDGDWVQCDVTREDEVSRLMRTIVERKGRLDYAFNNAGSGDAEGLLENVPLEAWEAEIRGYLTSVFLCLKHELRIMHRQGFGVIVNNSSVDGKRAYPWEPPYAAAKHGVLGLTKSVALQYAKSGIRVNAVCPGWVRTQPVENIIQRDPAAEAAMLAHQPMGRFGRAEEIAEAVVWLCSDAASFVTGTALDVDGGYLAM